MPEINFSIQKIVNEALVEREEKRKINSWHASGFGTCPTGRYLERLGISPDEEFDDRTLRVFAAGKKFEEFVLDLAVSKLPKGVNILKQVRVEDDLLGITGYADAVINFLSPEQSIVYELKTQHSRSFHWMKKRGESAMRHHEMQLWIYLNTLKIEEGRILYVSKDDLCLREAVVYWKDDKLAKEVMDEADLLNRAWREKLPPRPPADPKDWRCKYCRWHKQCVAQEKYLN